MRLKLAGLAVTLCMSVCANAGNLSPQTQLMLDYVDQNPGHSTLFLYQEKLGFDEEATAAKANADTRGLNVTFRSFYGSEIAKSRIVEELHTAGYERILFMGDGEDAVTFLKTAADESWGPEFIIPANYAEPLLTKKMPDYPGDVRISMSEAPKDENPGVMSDNDAKKAMAKMVVTAKPAKNYDRDLCEHSRRSGSHLLKTRCWRNKEEKERDTQKAQEWYKERQRGNVQRPPGG